MSKVIFLNGCGSSGKTSIAHALQHLSSGPWLHFSMDMFIDMMPEQYIAFGPYVHEGYFAFVPGTNVRGPTVQVETRPRGKQVFGLIPTIAQLIATQGNDLIIDEVLLGDEDLKAYVKELKEHTVYFVGVHCELSAMEEREISRGDRPLGLSNAQFDIVHSGLRIYDMTVDTTHHTPFEIAQQILGFIDTTPDPQAFIKIRGALSL